MGEGSASSQTLEKEGGRGQCQVSDLGEGGLARALSGRQVTYLGEGLID